MYHVVSRPKFIGSDTNMFCLKFRIPPLNLVYTSINLLEQANFSYAYHLTM